MKKDWKKRRKQWLRILIGLNGLICLLPFFNACSDAKPSKADLKNSIENVRTNPSLTPEQKQEDIEQLNASYKLAVANDEKSWSGYQLAYIPFIDFEWHQLGKMVFWYFVTFSLQIVLILAMLYFALRGQINRLRLTCLLALLLLALSLVIIFTNPLFEVTKIHQIKMGYYVYASNLLLIVLLSLNRIWSAMIGEKESSHSVDPKSTIS